MMRRSLQLRQHRSHVALAMRRHCQDKRKSSLALLRHAELLNDPRVTHYSGEHNVVIGAPTVVDVPFAQQVGSELTCTMGNWTGAPTEYSYQWQFDGADAGTGTPLALTGSEVGMTATCIVTATGEGGTTTASPSNPVVVAA